MQENKSTSANQTAQQNEQTIDLKAIFYHCLSRWYWFLISVILALVLATLYLKKTTPVYTRSAKLLVKSDEKGRSAIDVSDFTDMGLLSNGVKINNELLTINSIDNIKEVVQRLHLDLNYTIDGRFHPVLLYDKTLPVNVNLIGISENTTASFDMDINDNKVTLSEFVLDRENVSGQITAKLGDTVNSPIGLICVHFVNS